MRFTNDIASNASAGFTLAEVLAALLFMAIVIPVAVQGLRIASQGGQVALRKGMAIEIADRVLNDTVLMAQSSTGSDTGTKSGNVQQGPYNFRYQTQNENWTVDAMRRITVTVFFSVQGQEYDVHLSTLLDTSMQ